MCGALPTESNLVFSRLQGERRRIWLEGRIRYAPATLQAIDECQPRHRRPACAYAHRPPVASLLLLSSC